MSLGVQDNAHGDCHTLSLAGELDVATAPALQEKIDRLCEDGAREIVLDLHELSFIDSSGLRLIFTSEELCDRHGCDFSLSRVQPQAQRLFEVAGVVGRLSIRGRALARKITRRRAAATRTTVGRLRPDFEVLLDLNLDAPRSARNYVRDLLGADASPSLREAAMLLASDLVTPIVHRGAVAFLEAGELGVWLRPDVLRVQLEVSSELLLLGPERIGSQYEASLFDELADRWSVDADGSTACAWFELDCDQARRRDRLVS
jgi:anti-sigma B factor antagonist